MKKPILLLQFRTDKSLEHERMCILDKGKLNIKNLDIINVLDPKAKLPKAKDLNKYSAVITGASGQFNVTDWSDEIRTRVEKLTPFFNEVIKKGFPTLAICFGHQLVAQLLGGEVRSDPEQSEVGTFKVYLTDKGKRSRLFKDIPDEFFVVLGHKDSVTKLPKNAELLAYSDRCKVQAYKFGENFYAVQFHPELDKDGLYFRISLYPDYMKGKTKKEVMQNYSEIPYATKIIDNWREMIGSNQQLRRVKYKQLA